MYYSINNGGHSRQSESVSTVNGTELGLQEWRYAAPSYDMAYIPPELPKLPRRCRKRRRFSIWHALDYEGGGGIITARRNDLP